MKREKMELDRNKRRERMKYHVAEDEVKVYFESKNHAELVATFISDDIYMLCYPALEKQAKKWGMFVTESVMNKEED